MGKINELYISKAACIPNSDGCLLSHFPIFIGSFCKLFIIMCQCAVADVSSVYHFNNLLFWNK